MANQPTPNQATEPNVHDAVIHMRSQGYTILGIVESLGIPESRVRMHLERAGLVNFGQVGRHAKTYDYHGKPRTMRELAKIAGVSVTTMWRRLRVCDDAQAAVGRGKLGKHERIQEKDKGGGNR